MENVKEQFRQNILAITKLAKETAPLLKECGLQSEVIGAPTTLENIVLLVNPSAGAVGFWNVQSVYETARKILNDLECASILKAKEIDELDQQIANRQQTLQALHGQPATKFNVN